MNIKIALTLSLVLAAAPVWAQKDKCLGGGPDAKCGGSAAGPVEVKPGKKPNGGEKLPGKAKPGMGHRAVEAGDAVFLKMPEAVMMALRPPMSAEGVPNIVAVINGIEVGKLGDMIKTKNNVVTTVDAKGRTAEGMLSEKEVAMLSKLGAKKAGDAVMARDFLRLPSKAFLAKGGISMQVLWPKKQHFQFSVSTLKKKPKGKGKGKPKPGKEAIKKKL